MLGKVSRYSNRLQPKNSGLHLFLSELGSFKKKVGFKPLIPKSFAFFLLDLCLDQLSLLWFVKQTQRLLQARGLGGSG